MNCAQVYSLDMPELPEVEITARRPAAGFSRTADYLGCSSEAPHTGSSSMLKSSVGAEWVRAPIEM